MKTITINELMSWHPCYSRAEVEAIANGHPEMTALEVLRLDIPISDRLWVVLRQEVLDDKTLRLFAFACAERVLPIYEVSYPDDMRPRNAIETARRYADGEATKEELEAAVDAARDAARAAAYAACAAAAARAAWDAAYAACAVYAAGDAARDAARVAARATVWAVQDAACAVQGAAQHNERQWQVDTLIAMLEKAG